jgi:hypothetical protein
MLSTSRSLAVTSTLTLAGLLVAVPPASAVDQTTGAVASIRPDGPTTAPAPRLRPVDLRALRGRLAAGRDAGPNRRVGGFPPRTDAY